MENIHIHIGVVDKLLKSMEDMLFPTKEQGLCFMDNFLKKGLLKICVKDVFTLCKGLYSMKVLSGMPLP